jgi:hypothetical protein
MAGTRAQDPADRVFTIDRTSCSRSPEYAPERDAEEYADRWLLSH